MAEELMELPTEKRKPSEALGSILLYAEAKVGKSTTALDMFPDALVLDTEGGTGSLEAFVQPIPDWLTFRRAGAAIAAQPERFPAVIIDTADSLAGMCADWTIRNLAGGAAANSGRNQQRKFVHASDFDMGKGYAAITDEWSLRLARLFATVPNVILLSHAEVGKETDQLGREVTRYRPDVTPKGLRRFLEDTVSWILFGRIMQTDEGPQRVIHTAPGPMWLAGGRTLKGKTLPDPLPMDGQTVLSAMRESKRPDDPPAEEKPKTQKRSSRSKKDEGSGTTPEGVNGSEEGQDGAQGDESAQQQLAAAS